MDEKSAHGRVVEIAKMALTADGQSAEGFGSLAAD
jgi:hypothetical protein